MKTTENVTNFKSLNLETPGNQKVENAMARPLRSLRPMKSMARIKSIKPTRIEILVKRKQIKGL